MSPFKLSRLGTLDIDTLTRQMNLIAGAEDDPIRRLQILANVRWLLDDDIRTAVANALERSLEGMIRAERGSPSSAGSSEADSAERSCSKTKPRSSYAAFDHP
jgi:hypothetical protein